VQPKLLWSHLTLFFRQKTDDQWSSLRETYQSNHNRIKLFEEGARGRNFFSKKVGKRRRANIGISHPNLKTNPRPYNIKLFEEGARGRNFFSKKVGKRRRSNIGISHSNLKTNPRPYRIKLFEEGARGRNFFSKKVGKRRRTNIGISHPNLKTNPRPYNIKLFEEGARGRNFFSKKFLPRKLSQIIVYSAFFIISYKASCEDDLSFIIGEITCSEGYGSERAVLLVDVAADLLSR